MSVLKKLWNFNQVVGTSRNAGLLKQQNIEEGITQQAKGKVDGHTLNFAA